MRPIRFLVLTFALACISVAKAETYPERPIRLIVPFAAAVPSISLPASWAPNYRRSPAAKS